ncbi:putative protease of the Abi (CAAX) family [Gloeocapsa sp. PCC 73106]|nr:putative protease of the Abi (CAAX) family [Gloeocapsa sp. PCC 73106]
MINNKNRLTTIAFLAVLILLLLTQFIKAESISSYELSQKAPFNQISNYPVIQNIDTSLYQPTGTWVGRLILPEKPLFENNEDGVWVELYHTPKEAEALIGKTVALGWQKTPYTESYVQAVTTDVRISPEAKSYQADGNVIPTRLDGRNQVGPLVSLAGSRPENDLIVRLESIAISEDQQGNPLLLTNLEPIQVTGVFYGLVQILAQTEDDYFLVRHYNQETGNFDGVEETVRIPQQPADNNGRFLSTSRNLQDSAVGDAGWYIYGAKDHQGIFTVQSLKPRSILQLNPGQVIINPEEAINYIRRQNWLDTPERKGTFQSVLLDTTATSPEEAISKWEEGDRALIIHLFGGIGGEKAEPILAGTVTGHFAYGLAEVIRERFTKELQFKIIYQQIYAHNPNAIISGSLDWPAYTGNLRRGWLGIRPISDVVVKLDSFTEPLEVQGTSFYFLQELLKQAQILSAKYRTGNGTGVAAVTPATSCVQDSSQALYIAIERIKGQILAIPNNQVKTKQFIAFIDLGKDLLNSLQPRGVIRPDWQENAEFLAGIEGERLVSEVSLANTLDSWNSMLPRQAHDQVSRIFLDHGGSLWFLRTNQIGGEDPTIEPIAPTIIFGQFPLISLLFARLVNSLLATVTVKSSLIAGGLLLIYGAIAIPVGWKTNFLSFTPTQPGIIGMIRLLFFPALTEEIFMRVFMLPHPAERALTSTWLIWGGISLAIFILYHPLNALTLYRVGYPTFLQPVFLLLTGLLGIICAIAYYLTGSLIIIVLIHWIIVMVWLFILGGQKKLKNGQAIAL